MLTSLLSRQARQYIIFHEVAGARQWPGSSVHVSCPIRTVTGPSATCICLGRICNLKPSTHIHKRKLGESTIGQTLMWESDYSIRYSEAPCSHTRYNLFNMCRKTIANDWLRNGISLYVLLSLTERILHSRKRSFHQPASAVSTLCTCVYPWMLRPDTLPFDLTCFTQPAVNQVLPELKKSRPHFCFYSCRTQLGRTNSMILEEGCHVRHAIHARACLNSKKKYRQFS